MSKSGTGEGLPSMQSPRVFAVVFLLATVAVQVPLWSVRWVPMGDVGGHIELMDVVIRYDDPATVYDDVYTRYEGIAPNTFTLVAAHLLGPVADARVIAKLLFGLFALTLPPSLLLLCGVFGRSRWLSFAAFPFVYGGLTNYGLLNFLLAVPLIFTSVALSKRFADRGGLGAGALLGACLVVTFFVHGIALFFALGCVALVLTLHVGRARDLWRFWPLAAPIPLMVPWLLGFLARAPQPEAGDGPLGAFWAPGSLVAQNFAGGALRYFRDGTDMVVSGLMLICWGTLIYSGWRGRRGAPPRGTRERVEFGTPAFLVIACLAAFFVLPVSFRGLSIISGRVPILVCLFLVAAAAPDLGRRLDRLALGGLAAIAIVYPLVVAGRFVAWERDTLGDVEALVATVEDRSRLATVFAAPWDETFYENVLWHIPKAMHALGNGGVTNDSFAAHPYTPIQYQPFRKYHPLNLEDYLHSPGLSRYPALLVRAYEEPEAARSHPWLTLLERRGDFWLYDIAATEAGRPLWAVGGSGGAPANAFCPPGHPTRALEVALGPRWITAAKPRCESRDPARPRGFRRIIGRAHRNTHLSTLACPEPLAVAGIHGRSGARIDQLGVLCGSAGWQHDEELTALTPVGPPNGSPFWLPCPPGRLVDGLAGFEDGSVVSLGITCGP